MIHIPPLHAIPIEEGWWWACSEPERPIDMFIVWDERCPKCIMQAELVLRVHGDINLCYDRDLDPNDTPISQMIANMYSKQPIE